MATSKTIAVLVSSELHSLFKASAAACGMSMNEVATRLLQGWVGGDLDAHELGVPFPLSLPMPIDHKRNNGDGQGQGHQSLPGREEAIVLTEQEARS